MIRKVAMISVHECPLASSEGKERGGINVYTYELAKALSSIGWHVDLFTRLQDTVNPPLVQVNPSIRVIHISAGPKSTIPKSHVINYLPEFTQNMKYFIQSEHLTYTSIHAHYYYSGVIANALSNSFVMTFHTLGMLRIGDFARRIEIEKELVNNAKSIIATSENDATYLKGLYNANPSHIKTILPGVDTTLFQNIQKEKAKRIIGADPHHRIILSVGRIDPVKGFDVLLYALKLLELRDVCLWIVGGDVDEKRRAWDAEQTKLEKLRQTLGLETTVKFIPAQPQEKLPAYYNAAEVLVMPSHYESFGMVALEALACGTPVITTDVTGISPLVKTFPKGHIVSANNPILLAQKLAHVLSHPLQENFQPDMSAFDWRETAKKVSEVYNSLFAAGS